MLVAKANLIKKPYMLGPGMEVFGKIVHTFGEEKKIKNK